MSCKYIFIRIIVIICITVVALLLPFPSVTETWLYYLFSSVFQGIAAILGLLLLWFVFLKNALWQKYFFSSTKLVQKWAQENSESLSSKAQPVLFELVSVVLVALIGLSIVPILQNISNPARVTFAFVVIALTLVALLDFGNFIYWGLTLEHNAPPEEKNSDNDC